MKILGLDIGTTTISAVVMENGTILKSVTEANDAFLPDSAPWERLQDPNRIRNTVLAVVEALFSQFPAITRIGITGQMHGIVYLDALGQPVSPLYTWQDGRGDRLTPDGETYASCLFRLTGYPTATGFGVVTHYYNLKNGLVPKNATVFCTIHDYIAMILSGRQTPVTDPSDAASLGVFHVEKSAYDFHALKSAGIDPSFFPPLSSTRVIGSYRRKAAVYTAIGDNQASFLGAAGGNRRCILVNVGTGSQFSAYSEGYMECDGLDTRPFPGGGYLLVGASLCGGRAYALLEQFFRLTGQMLGCEVASAYDAMNMLLSSTERPADIPIVTPLFQGTRKDSTLRGSIAGLSTQNFTPLHFIWGMLEGMAAELHQMYLAYLASGGSPAALIGSGNGLRKNRCLQNCFSRTFGQHLTMSCHNEEAAAGAAVFASLSDMQQQNPL